ncbi:MAG: PspC domain-containing protein [Methylococcus sp.]
MSQHPRIPYPPPARLERNTRRRRLGGVCAGLADYTGWDVSLIRFLFLASMLFGGLGFWTYMVLWMVLPAEEETPFPKVSWTLRWALKKLERQVGRLNRKHDPRIGDQVQEVFDSVKWLAAELEPPGALATNAAARHLMLSEFPRLVDSMQAMSSGQLALGLETHASPARILLEQLWDQAASLQEITQNVVESRFMASIGQHDQDSAELKAWRDQLRPLQQELRERANPETCQLLTSIEDKLGFLMGRMEGQPQELLDLRPFEVRKIAYDYLPDTLNEYLRLPSGMAESERLHDGKTAEEVLNEQLTLLDTTLHDLARSLFEKDAAGLLVHGRFLKEKFADPRDALQQTP